MSDTFGTVTFTVLHEGMGRQQGAELSFQHIPGGNVTYVDYGGQTPLTLPYRLLFASAATYQLMETKVGGTATLISVVDGTIATAVLSELGRGEYTPDGQTFANATFHKVS
jgi:hypothetical protein